MSNKDRVSNVCLSARQVRRKVKRSSKSQKRATLRRGSSGSVSKLGRGVVEDKVGMSAAGSSPGEVPAGWVGIAASH